MGTGELVEEKGQWAHAGTCGIGTGRVLLLAPPDLAGEKWLQESSRSSVFQQGLDLMVAQDCICERGLVIVPGQSVHVCSSVPAGVRLPEGQKHFFFLELGLQQLGLRVHKDVRVALACHWEEMCQSPCQLLKNTY